MTERISYRPATIDDERPAYAVFRRSLYDYLFRLSMVDAAEAKDPPIEGSWRRQSAWVQHLWRDAAENWVAVDESGRVVGWAMSVERDGHLELTHFFVEPGRQAKGIGRGLIRRAFHDVPARHKSIAATQDTQALSLYLRSGVHYITTSVEFQVTPRRVEPMSDLEFERLSVSDDAIEAIADIEQIVLGCRREADTRFLLGQRPAWLARRRGHAAGFAFGVQPRRPGSDDVPPSSGPIAALDASDLPAILDHVIDAAAPAADGEFSMVVPLLNKVAVAHLLSRRGRIDPFFVQILASDETMHLERWVHTSPIFIM